MPKFSLLILPGDGIGPEVMTEVRRVIDWFIDKRNLGFDIIEDLVGGAAYDIYGTPFMTRRWLRPRLSMPFYCEQLAVPNKMILILTLSPNVGC